MLKLAVFAIVKDEREDYLREWIEWHLLSGADFVYLMDNGSKIPLRTLLSDVCNLGLGEMHGQAMQHVAYDWFIKKFAGIVKWTAFIDADEFIVSKYGDIPQHLFWWLDPCPYGGLAISWQVFGNNDLYDNPSGSQVHTFTKRAADGYEMNKYIKSIVQLELANHTIDAHYFAYKNNAFHINEVGERVNGSQSYPLYRSIYINHYYIRSRKDYLQKIARGLADNYCTARGDEFEKFNPHCNTVKDLTATYLWKKLSRKTYNKFYNDAVYLKNNPDVQRSINQGHTNSGLEHWLIYGKKEGRKAI